MRGYIPLDRHGVHVVFQLIWRRYEHGAIILEDERGEATSIPLGQVSYAVCVRALAELERSTMMILTASARPFSTTHPV